MTPHPGKANPEISLFLPYRKMLLQVLLLWPPLVLGTSGRSSPHQLFNYTWQVINEAGDVVHSISSVSSYTPWPTLTPDLCKMALGATDTLWGLSHLLLPKTPNPPDDLIGGVCRTANNRAMLRRNLANTTWNLWPHRYGVYNQGFYICPGHHRDRSLNYKCGYQSDYYCASWGCETTGDTYWKPSSSWDYIIVKAGHKDLTTPCVSSWCNPLSISFTQNAKQASVDWTTRGYEWGLRLYANGRDPGLLFKIKLIKTSPSITHVAAGPNKVLSAGDSNRLAPLPPTLNNTTITTDSSPLQLTMPPAPPSSEQTLLNMLKESWNLLNSTQPDTASNCWLCFHSSPPFYEGVAVLATLVPTNNTQDILRFRASHKEGLTLTQLSGMGTCVHGQSVRPPQEIMPLCNQTFIPSPYDSYIPAPNGTYFACATGLTTHISVHTLSTHHDFCVLVQLIPRIDIYSADQFFPLLSEDSSHRIKREPIAAATLALVIGLGAVGTGTGIASLVVSDQQYNRLTAAIDADLAEIQKGITALAESLQSLAEVVLQNRRGLDLLLLQQGGLCAALKEECCFYADKTGIVEDSMRKVRESLERRKKEREQDEGWYKNWFSTSPFLTTLLPSILGPLFGLLLAISFGPWALRRLTQFVKDQIDDLRTKPIQVHYHRLDLTERGLDDYNGNCPNETPVF